MIKAVLIDIDNTLLDFDEFVKRAMCDGFAKFGICKYEDNMFNRFEKVNSELWESIERGEITFEQLKQERWNRIFKDLGVDFEGHIFEEYFRTALFDSAIAVDGAVAMLDYLKEKYILCVASNGAYEQQMNRLKKAGMLSYFAEFFISEKVGAAKPSKQFFSYCLDKLKKHHPDIRPDEVLMLGDSLSSDMLGAVSNGLHSCYLAKHGSTDTGKIKVDNVITSLSELHNII